MTELLVGRAWPDIRRLTPHLRSPQWPLGPLPVVALTAVAWIVILVMAASARLAGHLPRTATDQMSGMPGMARPGMSMPDAATAGSHLGWDTLAGVAGMWVVMIVATMLPTALPVIRHVATNTLIWRRRRAVALFAATYVACWSLVGVMLAPVVLLANQATDRWLLLATIIAALAWQFIPAKLGGLRECHRVHHLPLRGPQADRGVVVFAFRNASACVRSCWLLMLVMAIAPMADIWWTLAVFGIALGEKRAEHPRQAVRLGALALLGLAVVDVILI